MWVIDLSFYTSRSISHIKNLVDLTSFANFIGAHLVLMFVIMDLFYLFNTANQLRHVMGQYHASNLDEKRLEFIQKVKSKRNKKNKILKKKKKEFDADNSSLAILNPDIPTEEHQQPLSLKDYNKIVDTDTTLASLHIDKSMFDFLCAELHPGKIATFKSILIR